MCSHIIHIPKLDLIMSSVQNNNRFKTLRNRETYLFCDICKRYNIYYPNEEVDEIMITCPECNKHICEYCQQIVYQYDIDEYNSIVCCNDHKTRQICDIGDIYCVNHSKYACCECNKEFFGCNKCKDDLCDNVYCFECLLKN
jgi:hypothetical protein